MLNIALFILMVGCRDNKGVEGDTQDWWESDGATQTDEGSQEDKEESAGTNDDKPLEDIEDCPEDFDPQASCEGSWETTICSHEGVIWWCQDGAWLSEEDK